MNESHKCNIVTLTNKFSKFHLYKVQRQADLSVIFDVRIGVALGGIVIARGMWGNFWGAVLGLGAAYSGVFTKIH